MEIGMKAKPGNHHSVFKSGGIRKKLVVKLDQAIKVDKFPCGKRKGCASMVVRVAPAGAKTLN